MFFDSLHDLLRVVIVGPLAYVGLIIILRVSGKRTLAKMNAFDFAVTVALGSTLATILLSKDVSLSEGLLALAMLAALQFGIAWTGLRSDTFEQAVKSAPRALLEDGKIDQKALLEERVAADEVKAAVRKSGVGDLAKVAAVFLETDGSFSVIVHDKAGARTAFP